MTEKIETVEKQALDVVVTYKWLEQHIILGVPTRTLTSEEYSQFEEIINLSESAVVQKIYERVEE